MNRIVPSLVMLMLWTLSARAQPIYNPPIEPPPCEAQALGLLSLAPGGQNTNCTPAYTTNVCEEGNVVLTNFTFSPANDVCVGAGLSASCVPLYTNCTSVTFTVCTNDCGEPCTIGCPPPTTNAYQPEIVFSSWRISGVDVAGTNYGECPDINCLRIDLFFIPISCGTGTVTFVAKWLCCDTNLHEATISSNFTVRCPEMTVPSVTAFCGSETGGGMPRTVIRAVPA